MYPIIIAMLIVTINYFIQRNIIPDTYIFSKYLCNYINFFENTKIIQDKLLNKIIFHTLESYLNISDMLKH